MLSRASAVYLSLGRPPLFSPAGCMMLLLRPVAFSTHITEMLRTLTLAQHSTAHTHTHAHTLGHIGGREFDLALPLYDYYYFYYYLIGCFV